MSKTFFLVNGNCSSLKACLSGIEDLEEDCSVTIIYTSKATDESKREILGLKTGYQGVSIDLVYINQRKSGLLKTKFAERIGQISSQNRNAKIYTVGTRALPPLCSQAARDGMVIEIDRISQYQNGDPEEDQYDDNEVITSNGGAMVILIDYENVEDKGLVGSEYLSKDDDVVLFYSKDAPNIEKGYIEDFKKRANSFDIVKLRTVRKNGLDFYIAVRVGQILNENPETKVLIVSKDTGFNAIKEYCESYTDMKNSVVIRHDIETGIAVLDGDTDRSLRIQNNRKRVSIETEYAVYKTQREIADVIKGRLLGTGFEGEFDNIIRLIDHTRTPQERYLTTLKNFGRARGRLIYQIIKEAV